MADVQQEVNKHVTSEAVTTRKRKAKADTATAVLPDPREADDLYRLTRPKPSAAEIRLRGLFPVFTIGDLALVAPVELPDAVDTRDPLSPSMEDTLRQLAAPAPTDADVPSYSGLSSQVADCNGHPVFLGIRNASSANEVAGFVERLDPALRQTPKLRIEVEIRPAGFNSEQPEQLARPQFQDCPVVMARTSQQSEFSETARPELPLAPTHELEQHGPMVAPLALAELAAPAKRLRQAGAGIVHSAPLRPAPYVVSKPAVLSSNITFFEPSWVKGKPLQIPEFKPTPRAGKQVCQEVAPWFVPVRPKPPVLSLEARETPAGWKNPVPRFNSTMKMPVAPAPVKGESASELCALAEALDAAEPTQSFEVDSSVWPKRRHIPVITPIADWWLTCSNQVRIMVIALPLLLAIALKPMAHLPSSGAPTMEERPTAPVQVARTEAPRQGLPTDVPDMPRAFEAKLEKATKTQFDGFKRAIVARSAVEMADDFQAGLDNWDGNGQLGPSWSYDRTGFIRPRALGIYRPSTGLSDYSFEFLSKIDQRAVSWVFRASDLNNYYAMKLVDKTGGVTPEMALVHYAVIEGREGPKKEVPLPLSVYKDTLFRIRMDVQGPHFSVLVQGTVVDYWKDSRLKSGGVGFFASRGEESRVRWVQVTHQDDMLGKFCAFLAPYAM